MFSSADSLSKTTPHNLICDEITWYPSTFLLGLINGRCLEGSLFLTQTAPNPFVTSIQSLRFVSSQSKLTLLTPSMFLFVALYVTCGVESQTLTNDSGGEADGKLVLWSSFWLRKATKDIRITVFYQKPQLAQSDWLTRGRHAPSKLNENSSCVELYERELSSQMSCHHRCPVIKNESRFSHASRVKDRRRLNEKDKTLFDKDEVNSQQQWD